MPTDKFQFSNPSPNPHVGQYSPSIWVIPAMPTTVTSLNASLISWTFFCFCFGVKLRVLQSTSRVGEKLLGGAESGSEKRKWASDGRTSRRCMPSKWFRGFAPYLSSCPPNLEENVFFTGFIICLLSREINFLGHCGDVSNYVKWMFSCFFISPRLWCFFFILFFGPSMVGGIQVVMSSWVDRCLLLMSTLRHQCSEIVVFGYFVGSGSVCSVGI